MQIRNLTGRAQETLGSATQQDQLAKIDELKKKLEASKQELANTQDYFEFLSLEDQAKTKQTEAAIDAELNLLDTYAEFLETGKWDPTNTAIDPKAMEDYLATLAPGWNDASGAVTLATDKTDEAAVGESYAGTVMLDNSGVYDPANSLASNALNFVVPEGATEVYGRTVGKDIHVEVHYEDGTYETYVLKNMAVRPEPIYIYGGGNTTGLTLDFSQVTRISDGNWGKPFGETSGLYILGGSGADRIIGSQGADTIIGGAGSDAVYGLGGDDLLFGDAYNESGAAGFQTDDGNDTMDGGAGKDIIRAGGGNQDQIINANGDSVGEHENPGATEQYEEVSIGAVVTSPGVVAKYQNGTLVVDGTTVNGTLDLEMPEGYTMASAEADPSGKSLVITMGGFDTNGAPRTMRVKITNFFDPETKITLNFQGNGEANLIDFHNVTLKGNAIHLYGNAGDDTILAPKTYLDALGIPASELGVSTVSTAELVDLLEQQESVTHDADGKKHNVFTWGFSSATAMAEAEFAWAGTDDLDDLVQNGEIVLQSTNGGGGNGVLDFAMPEGFSEVVSQVEGDDRKLIFLRRNADNTVDQVVVRIKSIGAGMAVLVGGVVPPEVGELSSVVGGKGTDTIYASQASVDLGDASNEKAKIIAGTYAFTEMQPVTPQLPLGDQIKALEQNRDDLKDEIGGLEASLDQAKTAKDDTKAAQLQKQLDEKYTELSKLETQIAKLKKQQ